MSISRLTISWKADAKVGHITIQSKYIYHFFTIFLKQFCNSLIDKDVVEHKFKREGERAQGATPNYIMRARERRKATKLLLHRNRRITLVQKAMSAQDDTLQYIPHQRKVYLLIS